MKTIKLLLVAVIGVLLGIIGFCFAELDVWSVAYDTGGKLFVYKGAKYTLSSGTISGGDVGSGSGGGVEVWGGTFTMSGGTIKNCAARFGGGVDVFTDGVFKMSSGTISGNTADAMGGGVSCQGEFTMSGGTIENNTANCGGGVYVLSGGTFTMTGGTIRNNTATYGADIYIFGGIFNYGGGTINGEINTDTTININKKPTSKLKISYYNIASGTKIAKIASNVSCTESDFEILNLPEYHKVEIQTIDNEKYLVVAMDGVQITFKTTNANDGESDVGSVSKTEIYAPLGSEYHIEEHSIVFETDTVTASANLGYELWQIEYGVEGVHKIGALYDGHSGTVEGEEMEFYFYFRASTTVTVKSMAPWTSGRLSTAESPSKETETTLTVAIGSKIIMPDENVGASSGYVSVGYKRVAFECGSDLVCDGFLYPSTDGDYGFSRDTIVEPVEFQIFNNNEFVSSSFMTVYVHFRRLDSTEFENLKFGMVGLPYNNSQSWYRFGYDDMFMLLLLRDYLGTFQGDSPELRREELEALYFYYLKTFPVLIGSLDYVFSELPQIGIEKYFLQYVQQKYETPYLGDFSVQKNFNLYENYWDLYNKPDVDFYFNDYFSGIPFAAQVDNKHDISLYRGYYDGFWRNDRNTGYESNYVFANYGVTPYVFMRMYAGNIASSGGSIVISTFGAYNRTALGGFMYGSRDGGINYMSGIKIKDWLTDLGYSSTEDSGIDLRGTANIFSSQALGITSLNFNQPTNQPYSLLDLPAFLSLISSYATGSPYGYSYWRVYYNTSWSTGDVYSMLYELGFAKKILLPSQEYEESQGALLKTLAFGMRTRYPYLSTLQPTTYYFSDYSLARYWATQENVKNIIFNTSKDIGYSTRILPILANRVINSFAPNKNETPSEKKQPEKEYILDTKQFTTYPERRKKQK